MASDTTRVLGGEGQELLTTNKRFPALGFFSTLEGSSLVSQEAGGLPGPPPPHSGTGSQALWRLGLQDCKRTVVALLSGLTSQKSVS